jgi:hypothetical protein
LTAKLIVLPRLMVVKLLKVGYSRICACAGLLFMWGHRKLSSSVCARSSLKRVNNTRIFCAAAWGAWTNTWV